MIHTIIMEVDIIIALQQIGNSFWDSFFVVFSYLASYIGAICLFFIVFFLVNKRYAILFGAGYLFSVVLNFILKVIINRPRPYEISGNVINKLEAVGQSFPSGHMVSITFMVMVVLFLLKHLYDDGRLKLYGKTWYKILIISVCTLVILITAIARMYLGQHYITDIIGGIVVGGLGFVITYFVIKMIEKKSKKC